MRFFCSKGAKDTDLTADIATRAAALESVAVRLRAA